AMHVQWSKSMARRDRWAEEVSWDCEEMRRIIHFFDSKSNWWLRRANRRTNTPTAIQRGAAAYVARQAQMYISMAHSFAVSWYPYLRSKNIDVDWLPHYIPSVYIPYKPRCTDPEVQ
ncbi:hypothetical protein FIBSPDRAFT_748643, partial [Athelia psychrophila]